MVALSSPTDADRRAERVAREVALLRERLPDLAARYGVRGIASFGSRVRGDHRDDSDLDILVTFDRVPGLLRFLVLEDEFSELLGRKVDLVDRESLRPEVAAAALGETEPV